MPSITLHRHWCKNCQDWTLFGYQFEGKHWTCKNCFTPQQKTTFREIPQEKIDEQQARYKEQRINTTNSVFGILSDAFSGYRTSLQEVQIIEHDAGFEDMQQRIRDERLKVQKEREELRVKYKDLGRNDLCICGSGLKYKKCCYGKI